MASCCTSVAYVLLTVSLLVNTISIGINAPINRPIMFAALLASSTLSTLSLAYVSFLHLKDLCIPYHDTYEVDSDKVLRTDNDTIPLLVTVFMLLSCVLISIFVQHFGQISLFFFCIVASLVVVLKCEHHRNSRAFVALCLIVAGIVVVADVSKSKRFEHVVTAVCLFVSSISIYINICCCNHKQQQSQTITYNPQQLFDVQYRYY